MPVRFVDLPRHRRRSAVMRLKNLLRGDQGTPPSKTFWTYEDVERLQQDGEKSCFDLLFLGLDRFTYWRARLFTRQGAEQFIFNETAHAETIKLLSKEERQQDDSWSDAWMHAIQSGKNWHTWSAPQYASLGGLTYEQHVGLVLQRIKSAPPVIEPEFWVRTNYVNGIGLFAIVDQDVLDIEVIEERIDRFKALGEVSMLPRGRSQFSVGNR